MRLSHLKSVLCLLFLWVGTALAAGVQSQFSVPPDPFPDLPEAAPEAAPVAVPEAKPEAKPEVVAQKPKPEAKPRQPEKPLAPSKPETSIPAKPDTTVTVAKPQVPKPPAVAPNDPVPVVALTVNSLLANLKTLTTTKQLAIHAPGELLVGETLQFSVTSKQDCFLTVLSFSRDGGQMLVFPNQAQPDNYLRANQKLVIPSATSAELVIQGKPGLETLVALCRPDKTPLHQDGYPFGKQPFIALHPGKQIDPKLMLAQSLHGLGNWAVASIAVKNYRLKFE